MNVPADPYMLVCFPQISLHAASSECCEKLVCRGKQCGIPLTQQTRGGQGESHHKDSLVQVLTETDADLLIAVLFCHEALTHKTNGCSFL